MDGLALKKWIPQIIQLVIMLAVGGCLSIFIFNKQIEATPHIQGINTDNNWFAVAAECLLLVALVVIGYLYGGKYERT